MKLIRPRHSTVVAYFALFLTLSGTAYAATGGTFVLGRHNDEQNATSVKNTSKQGGPVLRLNAAGKDTPNFTVNNKAKIKGLNADEVDGLTSGQLQRKVTGTCLSGTAAASVRTSGALACSAATLPALYIPVSAGKSAAVNGAALRAALAKKPPYAYSTHSYLDQVLLLSPGTYDLGSDVVSIPNTDSLVGAGTQVTKINTSSGLTLGCGPGQSLSELTINASSSTASLIDMDGGDGEDCGGIAPLDVSDVDLNDSSPSGAVNGILADATTVNADNVQINITSPAGVALAETVGGGIVFRNGYIAAYGIATLQPQDGETFPEIFTSQLSRAPGNSTTYCSGDVIIDQAGFTPIPDGQC